MSAIFLACIAESIIAFPVLIGLAVLSLLPLVVLFLAIVPPPKGMPK